jgi:hypothetical protein
MKCRYVGSKYMHFMTANNILLHQSAYVQKVLEKINMDKAYPLRTPIVVHALEKDIDLFMLK